MALLDYFPKLQEGMLRNQILKFQADQAAVAAKQAKLDAQIEDAYQRARSERPWHDALGLNRELSQKLLAFEAAKPELFPPLQTVNQAPDAAVNMPGGGSSLNVQERPMPAGSEFSAFVADALGHSPKEAALGQVLSGMAGRFKGGAPGGGTGFPAAAPAGPELSIPQRIAAARVTGAMFPELGPVQGGLPPSAAPARSPSAPQGPAEALGLSGDPAEQALELAVMKAMGLDLLPGLETQTVRGLAGPGGRPETETRTKTGQVLSRQAEATKRGTRTEVDPRTLAETSYDVDEYSGQRLGPPRLTKGTKYERGTIVGRDGRAYTAAIRPDGSGFMNPIDPQTGLPADATPTTGGATGERVEQVDPRAGVKRSFVLEPGGTTRPGSMVESPLPMGLQFQETPAGRVPVFDSGYGQVRTGAPVAPPQRSVRLENTPLGGLPFVTDQFGGFQMGAPVTPAPAVPAADRQAFATVPGALEAVDQLEAKLFPQGLQGELNSEGLLAAEFLPTAKSWFSWFGKLQRLAGVNGEGLSTQSLLATALEPYARLQSQGSITDAEFDRFVLQYAPKYGEKKPEVLRKTRALKILYARTQNAADPAGVVRAALGLKPGLGSPGQALAPNAPRPGTVLDGYRFKGGDPARRESWEKVR